ncbi:MAG: hypothetical protein ACJ746_24105 [Bryobacteraceae bacterium]
MLRKDEDHESEVLQEFVAMIEADAQLRPSPGEFEMAYQARVAIDRIRFAIKATESTREHPEELREAGMQLLDALDRLEAAEHRFQNRWRCPERRASGRAGAPGRTNGMPKTAS